MKNENVLYNFDEQMELVKRYRNGDEQAFNYLYDNFKKVIGYWVKRSISSFPQIEYEEAYSEGLVGFIEAIKIYDLDKSTAQFYAVATSRIRNHCYALIAKETGMWNEERKLIKNIESLRKKGLSDDEIKIKLNLSDKKFNNLRYINIKSLNAELQCEDLALIDLISKDDDLEDSIIRKESNREFLEILKIMFTEREWYVMSNRYGFDGKDIKSQQEIADELNMCQAIISKIEKQCIKKVKMYLDFHTDE